VNIFLFIIQAVWFLLPAYLANTIPVFVRKLKILDQPVDFNIKFRKKPLFGKNKTFRGFFFGTSAGIITVVFQAAIYDDSAWIRSISLINYNDQSAVFLGFLLGFGALLGDLIESFFKRRVNIAPGQSWIFFDQSDYVIGAFALSAIIVNVKLEVMIAGIIISIVLHFISNVIGYYIGVREKMI
jgi:CDP-2,3-bis-(O-geranylgeranyl)-sn-glycerol synthase